MSTVTTATGTPARASRAQPGFLQVNGRRLFALQIVPTGPCHGLVLMLPAFVEEMNRCRSHVAAQARALAATGLHCVLLDHFGTGESDGRTDEVDWDTWLADATAAALQLSQQHPGLPLTLWGVRTGALLAAELAVTGLVDVHQLLFWQPVLDGKLFLNQYLRLRIASQLVHDTDRETTDTIRARLSAGELIEVAGYPLSGRMADSMATRRMADFGALAQQRLGWIEVVSKPEQPLALPSRKLVDGFVTAGAKVVATTVACPPIWQLQERDHAPELQAATLRVLAELGALA